MKNFSIVSVLLIILFTLSCKSSSKVSADSQVSVCSQSSSEENHAIVLVHGFIDGVNPRTVLIFWQHR